MSGDRLPCGHPNGWMLRLRDGPELYKYCWGCIIDKIGVEEVFPKPKADDSKKSVKSAKSAAVIKKKEE